MPRLLPGLGLILEKGFDLDLIVEQFRQDVFWPDLCTRSECHGVCLDLLGDFRSSSSRMTPRVLLAVAEDGGKPAPLNNPRRVTSVSETVLSQGWILLLHDEDLPHVPAGEIRRCLAKGRTQQNIRSFHEMRSVSVERIHTVRGLEKALRTSGQGVCASVPGGNNPREGLVEFLELIALNQPPECVVDPSSGNVTMGQLIAAATPSLPPLRTPLRDGEKDLLPGGILDEAYTRRGEVFRDATQSRAPQRNHLVCGPTSGGKTTLALIALLNEFVESRTPAIYIGPTRMLVQDVHKQFHELCEEVIRAAGSPGRLSPGDIILSTGEDSDNDWRIRSGGFRTAFLVNEKANLFIQGGAMLLRELSLVVADEAHMLSHPTRGGVLDMLLAKIKREAERRLDADESPLRILAITTEETTRGAVLKDFLTLKADSGSSTLEPVHIIGKDRPMPVEHWLQPRMIGSVCTPIHLTTIRKQADRIQKKKFLMAQVAEDARQARQHELYSLVEWHSLGHTKGIVADHSTERLFNTARKIAKRRNRSTTIPRDWLQELQRIAASSHLPSAEAHELHTLASHGLFLHYSHLGPELRQHMEHGFKKFPTDNDPPHLLFATETVMYGVNLPADILFLCDIFWPRDKRGFEPLTPNQFHNFLGRVGRYGCSRQGVQKAVIACNVPRNNGKELTSISLDKILSMYEEPQECTSNVFNDKFLGDMIQNGTCRNDPPPPAMRFVLDALRHIGEENDSKSCSPVELIPLMEHSFAWSSLTPKNRDLKVSAFVTVISAILEKAAGKDYDLPCVHQCARSDGSPSYAITQAGMSVVTMGTRATTYNYAQELFKVFLTQRPGVDAGMPLDLLAVGIVGLPECWEQLRLFTKEAKCDSSKVDKLLNDACSRENVAWDLLEAEIGILAPTDPESCANTVKDFVETVLADSARGLVVNEDFNNELRPAARSMYYRLATALLRWMRGEDVESIQLLAHPRLHSVLDMPIGSVAFKESYVRKCDLLLRALLRVYLSRAGSEAGAVGEGLKDLAKRLKYGIPAEGLPFTSDHQLSRRQIVTLLREGYDGLSLALHPHPDDLLERRLSQISELGLARAAAMIPTQYYIREMQQLLTEAGRCCPEHKAPLNSLQALFSTLDHKAASCRAYGSAELLDASACLGRLIKSINLWTCRTEYAQRLAVGAANGFDMLLAGPNDEPGPPSASGHLTVVVRVPWRYFDVTSDQEPAFTHSEVTLAGAVALCLISHFTLIDASQVATCLKAIAPRQLSVRDLIPLLSIDSTRFAVRAPDLYEAMLTMKEPLLPGRISCQNSICESLLFNPEQQQAAPPNHDEAACENQE